MAQQHIADIDPNDAMASLESDFSDGAGTDSDTGGAGTNDNASTTTATNSSDTNSGESPEALAARQAAEGEQARERETRNTNSRENSNSSNNSTTNSTLFDGAAAKPEGKVIEPADTDLIMIEGKLVPFGEVRGSTIFKPKYDQAVRERDALAAQAGEVDKRKQSIDAVEPFLRTLEKDVYGRTYIETLTLTGDPERARKAAEAAAGVESGATAARQAQVDPRLVPPTDENGDALPEDDPRWIKWRTGPFNEATTEAATRKVLDEHQAKADREAKAQRDADNERTRTQQTADAAVQGRVQENLRVLSNLGPELIKRGVDVGAMTPAEWQNARNLFAETLRSHDKDVSDEYLRTKELTLGDVRAVIGSEGFLAKVQPAAKAAPATAAAVATANGTTNGAAGNNGAANGRPAMQNNYARQPLNAGGPSDAVAGADGGARSVINDEDATLQAMESLG